LAAKTGEPYGYVNDSPLNGTDASGMCPFFVPQSVCDAAGNVGGAIVRGAEAVGGAVTTGVTWAAEHPGVIAGGVGLAAATVATGGAALALGGAAIALTGLDIAHHDYLGAGLDVASLIPGVGAEFETWRAGALDDAALEEWTRSGVSGLQDTVGIWHEARGAEGWGGAMGWTSAGLGFLGGIYTLTAMEAIAAGGC
jgi:hypothetical protein